MLPEAVKPQETVTFNNVEPSENHPTISTKSVTSSRFASRRPLERSLKRGADELMNLAEYVLRDKPRALKQARKVYKTACLALYRALERAALARK